MEPSAGSGIESPIFDVGYLGLRVMYTYTREEYRHFARECLRFATKAKDDRERQIFLGMADAWTVVAFTAPLVIERTGSPAQISVSDTHGMRAPSQ
jgi:hypothetical protein